MTGGGYKIVLLRSVARYVRTLPDVLQGQIKDALEDLSEDPQPEDSVPLRARGAGLFRVQVFGHRIIYRIKEKQLVVLVVRIGPRGNVYRGFEPRSDQDEPLSQ